jgi:hypothetical protein
MFHDRTDGLASLLKNFERRIVKPRLRRLKPWRRTTYGDIHVNYRDHLGGRTSGMEYLPLFHDLEMPHQARVFEWCAGPDSSALLSSAMDSATPCVSPTSIQKQFKHAGALLYKSDWQSGLRSITLTISTTFRHPSGGIWW